MPPSDRRLEDGAKAVRQRETRRRSLLDRLDDQMKEQTTHSSAGKRRPRDIPPSSSVSVPSKAYSLDESRGRRPSDVPPSRASLDESSSRHQVIPPPSKETTSTRRESLTTKRRPRDVAPSGMSKLGHASMSQIEKIQKRTKRDRERQTLHDSIRGTMMTASAARRASRRNELGLADISPERSTEGRQISPERSVGSRVSAQSNRTSSTRTNNLLDDDWLYQDEDDEMILSEETPKRSCAASPIRGGAVRRGSIGSRTSRLSETERRKDMARMSESEGGISTRRCAASVDDPIQVASRLARTEMRRSSIGPRSRIESETPRGRRSSKGVHEEELPPLDSMPEAKLKRRSRNSPTPAVRRGSIGSKTTEARRSSVEAAEKRTPKGEKMGSNSDPGRRDRSLCASRSSRQQQQEQRRRERSASREKVRTRRESMGSNSKAQERRRSLSREGRRSLSREGRRSLSREGRRSLSREGRRSLSRDGRRRSVSRETKPRKSFPLNTPRIRISSRDGRSSKSSKRSSGTLGTSDSSLNVSRSSFGTSDSLRRRSDHTPVGMGSGHRKSSLKARSREQAQQMLNASKRLTSTSIKENLRNASPSSTQTKALHSSLLSFDTNDLFLSDSSEDAEIKASSLREIKPTIISEKVRMLLNSPDGTANTESNSPSYSSRVTQILKPADLKNLNSPDVCKLLSPQGTERKQFSSAMLGSPVPSFEKAPVEDPVEVSCHDESEIDNMSQISLDFNNFVHDKDDEVSVDSNGFAVITSHSPSEFSSSVRNMFSTSGRQDSADSDYWKLPSTPEDSGDEEFKELKEVPQKYMDLLEKDKANPMEVSISNFSGGTIATASTTKGDSINDRRPVRVRALKDRVAPAKDRVAQAKDRAAPAKEQAAPAKDRVAPAKEQAITSHRNREAAFLMTQQEQSSLHSRQASLNILKHNLDEALSSPQKRKSPQDGSTRTSGNTASSSASAKTASSIGTKSQGNLSSNPTNKVNGIVRRKLDSHSVAMPSLLNSSNKCQGKVIVKVLKKDKDGLDSSTKSQASKVVVKVVKKDKEGRKLKDTSGSKLKVSTAGKLKDSSAGKLKDSSAGKLKDSSAGKLKDSSASKLKDSSAGKLKNVSDNGKRRIRKDDKEPLKESSSPQGVRKDSSTSRSSVRRALKDISEMDISSSRHDLEASATSRRPKTNLEDLMKDNSAPAFSRRSLTSAEERGKESCETTVASRRSASTAASRKSRNLMKDHSAPVSSRRHREASEDEPIPNLTCRDLPDHDWTAGKPSRRSRTDKENSKQESASKPTEPSFNRSSTLPPKLIKENKKRSTTKTRRRSDTRSFPVNEPRSRGSLSVM